MFSEYTVEIIASGIVVGVLIIARLILERLIVLRILRKQFDKNRRKAIAKMANLMILLLFISLMASIWGVQQDEIILFASSVLTILGVAFFAQWSHLSNITSGLIIFFDSSIKIGDTITIMEKDFYISGKIEDIKGLTFILKTKDGLVSIPNNTILQKPIQIDHPTVELQKEQTKSKA